MSGHDIIVIGASAGGLEVVTTILRALPADLAAALFVVQHVPAAGPGLLPEILSRAGPLPAAHPSNGAPVRHGQIYIAPPDHHMLLEDEHIHVVRGPKENGFRPAIDATFRTAGRAYGPRVVGVILTGMLDDGTAGLLALKRYGGMAVVQDPLEAAYPSMPQSACRYVEVDAVLSGAEIAPLLVRLAAEPALQRGEQAMAQRTNLEAEISGGSRQALQQADRIGENAPFSCPDCGGVLMEYYDGDLLRFRCQVGHAFSRESMLAGQAASLDQSLWAAFRALDERATLGKRLVRDAQLYHDSLGERRFARMVEQAEAQKEQIRLALIKDDEAEAAA